ncbi:MAG: hypothetical protein GXP47_00940, partial [Acidobacteria bacterium]|nr:hypothetical protein [Acidobacteriota bacterium]
PAPPRGAAPAQERGWIGGLEEASALLGVLTGVAPATGAGLGGGLPWVRAGGRIVACGLPVAVGAAEVQGPDGVYQLCESSVRREAAGRTAEALRLDAGPRDGAGPGFDLLWFGPTERHLVAGGRVEIEDLFARVVAPAGRRWLEKALVRRRRIGAGVLDGLGLTPWRGAATIEVRRPQELTGGGWDDPVRVVAVRETVEGVEGEDRRLMLRLQGGGRAEGSVSAISGGWEARFEGEGLAWRRLWCRLEEGAVVYGAEPTADPREPAVRTRWAFDLMSDLLKLGSG